MVILIGALTGTCSSLISRTPAGCWMCHIHCFPTTKISVEASGGREFSKYRLEAQTKITTGMSGGEMAQLSSSARCVLGSAGRASGERRRNFTMKKKIVVKMAKVKNRVMAVKK